ncbi:hypothetical protein L7F22_045230 [Adiantum nelumboides]|nr:hypothetical protein [Adiantum nelumboides]
MISKGTPRLMSSLDDVQVYQDCIMVPSSKHPIQASSSLVRNIEPPLHTKFCRLVEEFHMEHGLPLEGVDPRSLIGNNDISGEDWQAIFICPKPISGSQKKVKSYHVRTEFLQKLVWRHWDVYQEGPFMYEVGNQFAKVFALENCSEFGKHQISWANFAKRAMRASEERHNLQNKIKRWEEQMSGRRQGSKTTVASTKPSLKIEGMFVPLSSVPTEGCLVQLEEEDSRTLTKMKNIAEGRLKDYKMDTLQRHTPLSGQDGMSELWKIANRLEEKIFLAASDQHDYLERISLKMLNLETKTQNAPNGVPLPTSSAGTNQSSVRPSESVGSIQQLGQAGGTDQAEIVWSKMQTLKETYLEDMKELFNWLATNSREPMPQERLHKLNHFKAVLHRMIEYLEAAKGNLPKAFKQDKV